MNKEELKKAIKDINKKELTEEEMQKQSGSYIRLDVGTTHYELKGEGQAVVLVHGYATPYFIYDKLFEAFVESGYKVLRYDLLGRGFSQRTETDYTPELFAEQLKELTDKIFPDEKFLLVGTSMGGSICATFSAKYPEKVKKLVLLAPAGMDNFKPPLYMKLCQIKGFGEALFYNIAGKILLKKCASELYFSPAEEKNYYMRKFAEAAQYKGFLRCTLSSLRNTILRTDKVVANYVKLNEFDLPILCIWGTKDKTMPYYQSSRLVEICKNVELVTYENSGHIFLFDEGKRCAEDILNFFEKTV